MCDVTVATISGITVVGQLQTGSRLTLGGRRSYEARLESARNDGRYGVIARERVRYGADPEREWTGSTDVRFTLRLPRHS